MDARIVVSLFITYQKNGILLSSSIWQKSRREMNYKVAWVLGSGYTTYYYYPNNNNYNNNNGYRTYYYYPNNNYNNNGYTTYYYRKFKGKIITLLNLLEAPFTYVYHNWESDLS